MGLENDGRRSAYYVALGSSFAAGLGLGPRAPGSPWICRRSTEGYPSLLARRLRVPSFTDRTSSGSTMQHVLRGGQCFLGPQLDALSEVTRLVTLTAGGNDVRYVGDLTIMAYGNAGGIGRVVAAILGRTPSPITARGFPALEARFDEALAQIRRRSPEATVVVATYPAILAADHTCDALGITQAQGRLMYAVGEELARVTRRAAKRGGALLVDMAEHSLGHEACAEHPWVNGFRPVIGSPFHPNHAGAEATAEAIADALRARG